MNKTKGQEAVDDWRANARLLTEKGLYDPADEHASCGVGLVAVTDGVARGQAVG